jgi:hypothetical protein
LGDLFLGALGRTYTYVPVTYIRKKCVRIVRTYARSAQHLLAEDLLLALAVLGAPGLVRGHHRLALGHVLVADVTLQHLGLLHDTILVHVVRRLEMSF